MPSSGFLPSPPLVSLKVNSFPSCSSFPYVFPKWIVNFKKIELKAYPSRATGEEDDGLAGLGNLPGSAAAASVRLEEVGLSPPPPTHPPPSDRRTTTTMATELSIELRFSKIPLCFCFFSVVVATAMQQQQQDEAKWLWFPPGHCRRLPKPTWLLGELFARIGLVGNYDAEKR